MVQRGYEENAGSSREKGTRRKRGWKRSWRKSAAGCVEGEMGEGNTTDWE